MYLFWIKGGVSHSHGSIIYVYETFTLLEWNSCTPFSVQLTSIYYINDTLCDELNVYFAVNEIAIVWYVFSFPWIRVGRIIPVKKIGHFFHSFIFFRLLNMFHLYTANEANSSCTNRIFWKFWRSVDLQWLNCSVIRLLSFCRFVSHWLEILCFCLSLF